MTSSKKPRIPKLIHHKHSDRARVRVNGIDHYLGPWGAPETEVAYRQFCARLLTSGSGVPKNIVTVGELLEAYRNATAGEYKERQRLKIRDTLQLVADLYAGTRVDEFGPAKLIAVRQNMIAKGWCRTTINQRVLIVRKAFRWGAALEMLPGSVIHALESVEGLKRGKGIPEGKPVLPVKEAQIWKAAEKMPVVVQAMIEIQLWTGMRPGEIVRIRPADMVRDWPIEGIWAFNPPEHKTAHHGHVRTVLIGPKAQRILAPYLEAAGMPEGKPRVIDETLDEALAHAESKFLFKPADSLPWKPKKGRKRPIGERYSVRSYGRAITRACVEAGAKKWTPNQLRHSAATRIGSEFGPEYARIILGHSTLGTTRIYMEDDLVKAAEAMRKAG